MPLRRGASPWLAIGGLTALLGLSGCAVALIGVGAVAGYAVSRDHAELTVERPYDQVWEVCVDEMKRVGLLQQADRKSGRLDAINQGTHVSVSLQRMTELSVKIIVKARKNLLPKVEVAQTLATRLARRLN